MKIKKKFIKKDKETGEKYLSIPINADLSKTPKLALSAIWSSIDQDSEKDREYGTHKLDNWKLSVEWGNDIEVKVWSTPKQKEDPATIIIRHDSPTREEEYATLKAIIKLIEEEKYGL